VVHGVCAVTRGVRQICLVELRRRTLARPAPPRVIPPRKTASRDRPRFETAFINLESRRDRLAQLTAQLVREGVAAKRLAAMRGADAPDTLVTFQWDSTLNAHFDTKTLPAVLPMSDGERGCAASHVVLWMRTAQLADDAPPLLVLEDDVLLCDHFRERCEHVVQSVSSRVPPAERELLVYVGGEVAAWRADGIFARAGGALLREAAYVWQTSSYLLYPPAARRLVHELPVDCPVDNFLSAQILFGKLRALVTVPALVWQAAAYQNGNIVHTNVYKPPLVTRKAVTPIPSPAQGKKRLYQRGTTAPAHLEKMVERDPARSDKTVAHTLASAEAAVDGAMTLLSEAITDLQKAVCRPPRAAR